MARIEPLAGAHFAAIGLDHEPQDVAGYVIRDNDGRLLYMGGLWFVDGRAWATFWGASPAQPRLHRLAIRIVSAAIAAGVDQIWAEEDVRIPGARKWLERFGFERVGHAEDQVPVWRLVLDGRPGDHDPDGCKRSNERLWLNEAGQRRRKGRQLEP